MPVCAALLPALGRSLFSTDCSAIWYSHGLPWSEPHVFTELSAVYATFHNAKCTPVFTAIKLSVDGSVSPTEHPALIHAKLSAVC